MRRSALLDVGSRHVFGVVALLATCSCSSQDAPPEAPFDESPESGEELGNGEELAGESEEFVGADLIAATKDVDVARPLPGTGVGFYVHREDGSYDFNFTETDATGVARQVPAVADVDVTVAANDPCKDKAFSLEGSHWKKPYAWSFFSASTPKANSILKVEAALGRAASNITTARNSCGRKDAVGATSSYAGRTSKRPNIRLSGSRVICDSPDGKNVIGFGTLPGSLLGITCFYWTVDAAGHRESVEGDVRLDARRKWLAAPKVPAGCSGRYMVEGIATHELGHVFGLGHVSEAKHPKLTMSTATRACTNADATLGLGDVLGLEKMY